MVYTCEFCKKEFPTLVNVMGHQQRNKKCLKLQGKNNFNCPYCNKDFVLEENCYNHIQTICIKAKEHEIKELKHKIEELNKEIESRK